MTEKMTKTEARKIARHLVGEVHVVAANRYGKTWGYNYACGPRQITTRHCRDYLDAQRKRAEHLKQVEHELLYGVEVFDPARCEVVYKPAPDWMSLDFRW